MSRKSPVRKRRAGVAVALALFLAWPARTEAAPPRKPARPPATRASAPARPDAALYQEARRAEATLRATPKRQARKTEWENVVLKYRVVVARYPQSGYCDNALLAVGDLYRDMAKHFGVAQYADDAVVAYRRLVAEYPSSSLGDRALFSAFEVVRGKGDRRRTSEIGKLYLEAFPTGSRAREVKTALGARAARTPASTLTPAASSALARVYNLRFWSGDASTRVVLDLEREAPIHYEQLANPDRLFVDLSGTRLHPNLVGRTFPVGDGLLEQIRIAQNREDVVRVVLDFKSVGGHSVFYLHDPERLVIDVRAAPTPAVAEAAPPAASPSATPRPTRAADAYVPEPIDLPGAGRPAAAPRPTPEPLRVPARGVAELRAPASPAIASPTPSPVPIAIDPSATRRAAASPAPGKMTAWTRHTPSPYPSPSPLASPPVRTAAATGAPLPPQVNRAGSYSLARQLGLGARRIVIDAGHGGHDPGSIGPGGLQEKELVLDVALRLQRLVREELGAEVIMTRSTDVFVPLEERPAIANSKGADLFLSIHANSSRNARARGIETYFLSFAQDAHAEQLAARENAISTATMKDLQNLVKAITLNSKLDESRDFAASVQEAMVSHVRHAAPDMPDRGVRTAPLYVLIGANMPSVLAEISFLSNPLDERLLKKDQHRDRIARSLLEGVRTYLSALDRNRTRQLTAGAAGPTVTLESPRR